jgi:hypothetical protein
MEIDLGHADLIFFFALRASYEYIQRSAGKSA